MHKYLACMLISLSTVLYAQLDPPRTQAQEDALFEFAIDDNEVEIFIVGSWESRLGFAAGLSWIPNGDGSFIVQDILPSSLQSRAFSNNVNLITSLLINEQFFFEANFHSGFSDTSILFGYIGDGILKNFNFGTRNIGMSAYSFLNYTEGISGQPGLSLRLGTDVSEHEFFLRYEASNEVRRTFQGTNEYTEEGIAINSFLRGKYFLLPSRNPENLEVWLEGDSLDYGSETQQDENNARYRKLREGIDYGFDRASGELSIGLNLPVGRILVFFSVEGTALSAPSYTSEIPISRLGADASADNGTSESSSHVSLVQTIPLSLNEEAEFNTIFIANLNALYGLANDGTGIQLSDFTRSIDSKTALVLYDPNIYSPFEIQGYYAAEDNADALRLNSNNASTDLEFRNVGGIIQVLPQLAGNLSGAEESWRIRYPILSAFANPSSTSDLSASLSIIAGLYEPFASLVNGRAPNSLRGHSAYLNIRRQGASGIRIDEDYLPGTLFVYRNSELIRNYSVVDNVLLFPFRISEIDRILLVYRVRDSSSRLGNLTTALGNRFFIDENNEIALALGGTFGINDPATSTVLQENPASFQLSASYTHSSAELSAQVESGIEYAVANINSAPAAADSQDAATLVISEESLYPSALPLVEDLRRLHSSARHIRVETRSEQVYRDLRTSFRGNLQRRSVLNGSGGLDGLNGSGGSGGGDIAVLESVFGPYPALANATDAADGVLSAVEYNSASAGWYAYQVYGQAAARTSGQLRSVDMQVLSEYISGRAHIFLQAGNLNEDLDGDFTLDAQNSPNDTGFAFTHAGRDYTAGYPGRAYRNNWRGLSEDLNENGRLDSESQTSVFSAYLGELSPTDAGQWRRLSYSPSAEEAARVGAQPSLRIIIVFEEASSARLFFGDHTLHYNSDSGADASTNTDGTMSGGAPDNALGSAANNANEGVFSAGLRSELSWTPRSASVLEDTMFQTGLESITASGQVFSEAFAEGQGIDSRVEIQGFLPLFEPALSVGVYWDYYSQPQTSASHSFSLQNNPYIQFTESYEYIVQDQENMLQESEHRAHITFTPAQWFTLSADYLYYEIIERLNRQWELAVNLGNEVYANYRALYEIRERQNIANTTDFGYFESYAQSLELLNWSNIRASSYRSSLDIDAELGLVLDRQLLEIYLELESDYESSNILSEEIEHGLLLALDFEDTLYVNLEARQRFFYQSRGTSLGFSHQLEELFRHAGQEPYFTAPIYIGGVFADEPATAYFAAFSQGALAQSSLHSNLEYFTGLQFGRQAGVRAVDLLIPSEFELNIWRNLEWRQGIHGDTRRLESRISWQALNVFGSLSREGLFTSYESDEFYYDIVYRHNLSRSEDWSLGGEFTPSFFHIGPLTQLDSSFVWEWAALGETSLTLGFSLDLTWSSELQVDTAEILAQSPLLTSLSGRDSPVNPILGFEHVERIHIQFHAVRENSQAAVYSSQNSPGFSVVLRHSSRLIFSNVASFELNAALAYEAEALRNFNYEYSHSIGFELAAVLELSF